MKIIIEHTKLEPSSTELDVDPEALAKLVDDDVAMNTYLLDNFDWSGNLVERVMDEAICRALTNLHGCKQILTDKNQPFCELKVRVHGLVRERGYRLLAEGRKPSWTPISD